MRGSSEERLGERNLDLGKLGGVIERRVERVVLIARHQPGGDVALRQLQRFSEVRIHLLDGADRQQLRSLRYQLHRPILGSRSDKALALVSARSARCALCLPISFTPPPPAAKVRLKSSA